MYKKIRLINSDNHLFVILKFYYNPAIAL